MKSTPENRGFLFLQGPHGPFFNRLGRMLRKAGSRVWRVGFNAGDRAFWFHQSTYIPFRGKSDDWAQTFIDLIEEKGVTDIVLYGDTRPIHASAVAEAKRRGLGVHVFEEGYMRPFWITYERGGTNGNSRLMDMTIPQMQKALANSDMETPLPPRTLGRYAPSRILWGAISLVGYVSERRLSQFPPTSQPKRDQRISTVFGASFADAMASDRAAHFHTAD